MKRLLCLASVALLLAGCGSNKRGNEGDNAEALTPSVTPQELTATKDAAFAKEKNIQIVPERSVKNNKNGAVQQ